MNKSPLKQFKNTYYMSLESDYTSYRGFQHKRKLNEFTEAPDWNPNPSIDCGEGLHVVKGHPLLSHRFVTRKEPLYFEVKTVPDPPIPSSDMDGKFRAHRVAKVRVVDSNSPEFSSDVLAYIVKNDEDYDVRMAAIDKLNAETHSKLLADIAKNDEDYDVRQAAVEKLKLLKK